MSILAIQQLFQDADAQDLELQLDISKIEDSHLLEEVDKIGIKHSNNDDGRKGGRLVSLRDEQQRLVEQNQNLEDELATAKKTIEELEEQNDRGKQTNSNLLCELEALKRGENESKSGQGFKTSLHLQEELEKERDSLVQLRAELADAKDMLLGRGIGFDDVQNSIKKSKQFVQMRKLLTQKTDQLTDLRRRMLQYEPDLVDEEVNRKK